MNLFKKAILSLGGSLFKENVLPELADSYTSGFQETVKGIPIVGGFLDTRLTKFLTSSMLPSTTVSKKPLEMADLPSGDSVGGGFGVRSKRYGAAKLPMGNNQFVQNALGNPKIRNKLIDRYTTARLPRVNSPRPNFGVNLAAKPSPKLYKSKAEAKTETT